MAAWRTLNRDGVALAYRDFGGDGPPALLLHGLAGYGGEWAQTASWLTSSCHVVALDGRGHGHSERRPTDLSRGAHVADVAYVVEQLELAPVILVGQSLGGVVALLVASERPELVRALVLADACPVDGGDGDEIVEALARWPVPFESRQAAHEFFARRFGGELAAEAWAAGLERRSGGWWPRFDVDVIARAQRGVLGQPCWGQWERIECPALLVRAGQGVVDPAAVRKMVRLRPATVVVDLPGAAHDLHLDRPDEWRRACVEFLSVIGI